MTRATGELLALKCSRRVVASCAVLNLENDYMVIMHLVLTRHGSTASERLVTSSTLSFSNFYLHRETGGIAR